MKTWLPCELNIGFIYQAVNTGTTRGDKPFTSILLSFANQETSCYKRIRYKIIIFEKHLEVFLALKVGFCCRIRLDPDYSSGQGNDWTELWELSPKQLIHASWSQSRHLRLKLDTHARILEQWFSLCLTVQRFKHFHIKLHQVYSSHNGTWNSAFPRWRIEHSKN